MSRTQFTVFTKPWPDMSLPELARFIQKLGFHGVELPVRPGYQVVPENVEKGLPEAARIFADHGVKIGSVAGPADVVLHPWSDGIGGLRQSPHRGGFWMPAVQVQNRRTGADSRSA